MCVRLQEDYVVHKYKIRGNASPFNIRSISRCCAMSSVFFLCLYGVGDGEVVAGFRV